ncbi:hypothetical protein E2C01_043376 [Portunus trituberculatus]|uniref:Uncharacterized protein n=1 Tax=Portunus trituberculatus TaxID=210409 RepID=A0A5B7FWB4_PORTR|nr:hypothetical protein [Portunus trituberculatus]
MSRVCMPVLGKGDWNSSVNRIRKIDRIRARVCVVQRGRVCSGGLRGKMSCRRSASAVTSEAAPVIASFEAGRIGSFQAKQNSNAINEALWLEGTSAWDSPFFTRKEKENDTHDPIPAILGCVRELRVCITFSVSYFQQ